MMRGLSEHEHITLSNMLPIYVTQVRGRYIMDLRASDVWAMGVTFFNLLTGRLP